MPKKSHQQDTSTSPAITGGNTAIFAKTKTQIPNAIYDFGIFHFYSLILLRFFFWCLEKWNQSPPIQQDSDDDL